MPNSQLVPPNISLLWPLTPTSQPGLAATPLEKDTTRDLNLPNTIRALSLDSSHQDGLSQILSNLCPDPAVITYRQAILEDLLQHQALVEGLTQLVPTLSALERYQHGGMGHQTSLQKVTWRLGELENIVTCVETLDNLLSPLQNQGISVGLQSLQQAIQQISQDETYQHMRQALPELLAGVRETASITIGINLDHNLQPVAATLLSVNKEKFGEATLLSKLLGNQKAWHGLASLHGRPKPDPNAPHISPMLAPLFRDLAKVLDEVCYPIERALRNYSKINGGFLANLRRDLVFYLGAARLIKRLQSFGLPLCRPKIAPLEARQLEVQGNYNLNLAIQFMEQFPGADLKQKLVQNDLIIGKAGRVIILTGPNGGGKTTYVQAIGLTQIMAQAGLYVPGTKASISPVDRIFSHYPIEEELAKGTGRFGDEAQRLTQIFSQATAQSLILLNESLASTHAGESLYIAQDLMRILREMGARAVFATHLHDLAAQADELNQSTPGHSKIVSMVASRIEAPNDASDQAAQATRRSYQIALGPPMGRSYARELASRYGVSYEQLNTLLQKRGVLNERKDTMFEEALQNRLNRVAASFLENEKLTEDLDDEPAQILLDWALAWGKIIVQDTAGLDDEAAEEAMYPRLRAARKLARRINRWAREAGSLDPQRQKAQLQKLFDPVSDIFGVAFEVPNPDQIQRFVANPASNTLDAILDLRHFLENSLSLSLAEEQASVDKTEMTESNESGESDETSAQNLSGFVVE